MTTRAHVSHAATLFAEESRDKMPVLPSAIQSDGTHIDSADFGKALQHRYAARYAANTRDRKSAHSCLAFLLRTSTSPAFLHPLAQQSLHQCPSSVDGSERSNSTA